MTKDQLSPTRSKDDTTEATAKHVASQMLPEIRGAIKNVKQLVKLDLEADGVRKVNIPFSSFRRRQFSTQEETNSISRNLMFTSPSNQSLVKLKFDASQSTVGTSKVNLRGLNLAGLTSHRRKQSLGGVSDALQTETSKDIIVRSPQDDTTLFDRKRQMWRIQ